MEINLTISWSALNVTRDLVRRYLWPFCFDVSFPMSYDVQRPDWLIVFLLCSSHTFIRLYYWKVLFGVQNARNDAKAETNLTRVSIQVQTTEKTRGYPVKSICTRNHDIEIRYLVFFKYTFHIISPQRHDKYIIAPQNTDYYYYLRSDIFQTWTFYARQNKHFKSLVQLLLDFSQKLWGH